MKKRLISSAMVVALLAVVIVLNWTSIARAAISFNFGNPAIMQFIGGVTQSAAQALPAKMNIDSDGVTGHLVVDCSTGCSGGGGGGSAPFTGGASGVATAASQSIGLVAFNGTTMDALRDDASKNLLVSLGAALPAGTNTIGVLGQGFNTIGAVELVDQAGTNRSTINASGQLLVLDTLPLTGANSTGTAGAGGQTVVGGCNFTTTPATVVTGNVVPVACDNGAQQIVDTQRIANVAIGAPTANGTFGSGNIQSMMMNQLQVASAAVTTATGISGQHIYPANTSGGGCAGLNLSSGTQIARTNLAPVAITASEAATQIVAAVASKFVHVCGITITGVLSTGGAINVVTGTGVNCATGTATLATFQEGVNTAGFLLTEGTGEQSVLDSVTAGEICVSSGAFVATAGPTLNLTFAQY